MRFLSYNEIFVEYAVAEVQRPFSNHVKYCVSNGTKEEPLL